MGLLTAAEEAEARAAIKSVTDTFMITSVTYHKAGESLDRFQEDRKNQSFTDYTLPCLVEYKKDKIKEGQEGAVRDFDVMLTINIDDLIALNLASSPNYTVPFNAAKDYFTCRGIKYKVQFVGYDGPLSTKQCLVLIEGVENIKVS